MGDNHGVITAISVGLAGIIGVAMASVFFGKNSQAPTVIQNAGTALSSVLNAATAPVTNSNSTTFGG